LPASEARGLEGRGQAALPSVAAWALPASTPGPSQRKDSFLDGLRFMGRSMMEVCHHRTDTGIPLCRAIGAWAGRSCVRGGSDPGVRPGGAAPTLKGLGVVGGSRCSCGPALSADCARRRRSPLGRERCGSSYWRPPGARPSADWRAASLRAGPSIDEVTSPSRRSSAPTRAHRRGPPSASCAAMLLCTATLRLSMARIPHVEVQARWPRPPRGSRPGPLSRTKMAFHRRHFLVAVVAGLCSCAR
jgi:hypothetical protein